MGGWVVVITRTQRNKSSLFIRGHFVTYKKCSEILIRCQSAFFENFLDFDVTGELQKCF